MKTNRITLVLLAIVGICLGEHIPFGIRALRSLSLAIRLLTLMGSRKADWRQLEFTLNQYFVI
jgi:hypothetical protein